MESVSSFLNRAGQGDRGYGSTRGGDMQGANLSSGFETTHQSFLSKGSSACGMMCFGVFLVPFSLIVEMFNESYAVCREKAYSDAESRIKETNCAFSHHLIGSFVHLQCPVQSMGVALPSTDFSSDGFEIMSTTEMYQWSMSSHSTDKKDNLGGGTTTSTCYCFEKKWSTHHEDIDSSKFDFACPNCLSSWERVPYSNPIMLNDGTPFGQLGTQQAYAEEILLGYDNSPAQFSLSQAQVQLIQGSETSTASIEGRPPSGWIDVGSHQYWRCSQGTKNSNCGKQTPVVGDVRVSIAAKKTSYLSAIGKLQQHQNQHQTIEGVIIPQSAGGSSFPPCSASEVMSIETGQHSSQDMFSSLRSTLGMITGVLRLITWICCFIGVNSVFGPLSVAPDIIPCIGPIVGDLVGTVVWVFAFFIGSSLWLVVFALAYLFYRPLLCISLLLLVVLIGFGLNYYKKQYRGGSSLINYYRQSRNNLEVLEKSQEEGRKDSNLSSAYPQVQYAKVPSSPPLVVASTPQGFASMFSQHQPSAPAESEVLHYTGEHHGYSSAHVVVDEPSAPSEHEVLAPPNYHGNFCSNCGHPQTTGKFCMQCGVKL